MGDYQNRSDSMRSARKRRFASRIKNSHPVQPTRSSATQPGFVAMSASSTPSERRPYKPV
ncbi:uncharacterized protein N7473_006570 [Penicillium subrubescens]|nr:uncharacterized protein N7473_006570 [Penicillium subrubescens]KAJ5890342.1 hypothetical protein N7473_006570 [Penicillium subrubescens]